jgi:dynein heavy chain
MLTIEAFQKKPSSWKELFRECRMSDADEELTFTLLLQKGIMQQRENIEEISRRVEK